MKKIQLLIIVCLIIASTSCRNEKKSYDFQRLEKFRNEVAAELTGNLLPWWSRTTVDYENGGFYGRVRLDDSIIADADKAGIMNARILWTYSAAYRITKDASYLRLADRAKDYCLNFFIDKEYGGAYYTLDYKGEPKNTMKHIYTNSFFIYAFSEYARATGDKEALETAKAIFELFEKHALDQESNGYFEVFNREWERVRERMIGESSDRDEKTMNTSLHLMEAYTNLYRVWHEERIADRLRNMVELFLDKIIDPDTYHLINFMDREWNRTSDIESYGHDIECVWLLNEAATLLGDKQLIKRVEDAAIKIAEAVEVAIQPDGSLIYEKDAATGHLNENRSWWAQVETIVGYFDAWEISGLEKFLDYSLNCWDYTHNNFLDTERGGWFSSITPTGEIRGDKAGHWVCPYHNGRMCMEIMERVEKLLEHK